MKEKKELIKVELPTKGDPNKSGWYHTDKGELLFSHNYGWMKDSSVLYSGEPPTKCWIEK